MQSRDVGPNLQIAPFTPKSHSLWRLSDSHLFHFIRRFANLPMHVSFFFLFDAGGCREASRRSARKGPHKVSLASVVLLFHEHGTWNQVHRGLQKG